MDALARGVPTCRRSPRWRGRRGAATSTSRKPASLHQPRKSAPVKSKASPNSISMLSDIIRPKTFSRRASSIRFSTAMNAPPGGQRVVGGPDELLLPLQVPVVQDHAHRDHVGRRERIGEEVARRRVDPIGEAGRCDRPRRRSARTDRQVEARAAQVRVALRDDDRQLAGGAADVADASGSGEKSNFSASASKLPAEMPDIAPMNCSSRAGSAYSSSNIEWPVCLISFCGWPGLQRLGQIAPEAVQPGVGHLEDAADVLAGCWCRGTPPVSRVFA